MIDRSDDSSNDSALGGDGDARQGLRITRRPPMVRSVLLGSHTHYASNGTAINIWQRGADYLARGYYNGSRFGETLGSEPAANTRLMETVAEIGSGAYILPSQRRGRQLAQPSRRQLAIRQLIDEYLTEKRNVIGAQTTNDYRTRLLPLLEFAELDRSRKRWPLASDVDRAFVIEYRKFVSSRNTTSNGRPSAPEKRISFRHVYNVMDCARTLFNWGKDVRIAKLPITFANPFTSDLVGLRPRKDPLRPQLFPIAQRIEIVEQMDDWQLLHLALPLVLPLRPEDCAGLLIADVNLVDCVLSFGTRFDGRDFNKGRVNFTVPFPAPLAPLLRLCIRGRTTGPLLRSPSIWHGWHKPHRQLVGNRDMTWHINDALVCAPSGTLLAAQDHKKLVRRVIRDLGGVSEDTLAKEFGAVLRKSGLHGAGRFYDLRGAVSTELERAGVSKLVHRYVTGHTTSDILFEYASIDPPAEMDKYFQNISPLLEALKNRGQQLGLKLSN